jgi:3-dehydroquinate synthase
VAEMTKPTLWGRIPQRRVPIYLGDGILDRLPSILPPTVPKRSIEIVTDRTVYDLFAKPLALVLKDLGWAVHRTVLATGEGIKSARTITSLHECWFARKYDRHVPVIALGGGTVGDSVGYAAATFLRGVPLWQIPTTVLAQVDAAIGGKVGINHRRGKNLVGAFYHAQGIIIDTRTLTTLPVRERRSGLAEVVKYGVIADRTLFRRCERDLPAWVSGDEPIGDDVIKRCVRIKLRVVAADETDLGQRHILNFGHTLGHALERWGGYRRLRHGEAVALGMVGAGYLAQQRGLWSAQEQRRLSDLCRYLRPARTIPALKHQEILPHLKVDKKRAGGRNIWVLPRTIGEVEMHDDVTEKEVRGALRHIAEWLGQ